LAAGGNETHGVAQCVSTDVDFGAHAAAATAQALGHGGTFFWPAEC
jgi:hypothetical protein